METVIETVRFALNKGTDDKAYVAASEATQSFIAGQPGFLYRSLSKNAETDQWTDICYWDSMDNALSAGKKFMEDEDCLALVAHIDESTLVMTHERVKMSSCDGTA